MTLRLRLALPALLATLVACRAAERPSGPAVRHDLAADFARADVRSETLSFDLGTPEARPALISGWSWNQKSGDETIVWSEGPRSVLSLFLAQPRSLRLAFRCTPYEPPEAAGRAPQAIAIEVNGQPAGSVELGSGPGEYALALPVAAQRVGVNEIAFVYRHVFAGPARRGGRLSGRTLAVAWDWIRLTGGDAASGAPEAPRAAGSHLLLPAGSRVDYYFDLEAPAELEVASVTAARGRGRLAASLISDGEKERELALPGRAGGPLRVELPLDGRKLVRLSLRTVAEEGEPLSGVALVLDRPVVRARALPAPSPRAASTGAPASGKRPPDIVLYVVDTLRADRLGAYGSERGLTPQVDAFAAHATLYQNAVAQSSWTKASVASIFTGLNPREHGVNSPEDGLAAPLDTLAERLRAAGYRTAGFAANAYFTPSSGLRQGFDSFTFLPEAPNLSDELDRRIFEWVDRVAGDRASHDKPLFLYIHTIDPHAPYDPPEEYRRRFAASVLNPEAGSAETIHALAERRLPTTPATLADLRALYNAEVAFNDHQFGRLLDGLRRRGLYDPALVAFLSDHGEEFDEHGVLGHGWNLYRQVLRVPLIVKEPGQTSAVRETEPVEHIDLLPTLLRRAGLAVPPELRGRDLDAPGERPIFSYMDYNGRTGASLLLGGWHYIEPLRPRFAAGPELYSWRSDVEEKDDRASEHHVLVGYLHSLVRAEIARDAARPAERVTFDDEERKQLQALGYLGGPDGQ